MQLKHIIKIFRMNIPIIETYQIVQENTSKDPKRIKSSIYDTVYLKNFIGALKTEKIQFYRHEDFHGETIYIIYIYKFMQTGKDKWSVIAFVCLMKPNWNSLHFILLFNLSASFIS